jgi:hypothetical protein
MYEFLKKKWVEWLISVTLVVLTVILTNHFTVKRDTKTKIQDELKTKASIEYVNQQDIANRAYTDTKFESATKLLESHCSESRTNAEMQLEWMKSIDRKLNVIENTVRTLK